MRSFGISLIISVMVGACGTKDTNKDTSTTPKVAFTDVSQTVADSCATAGCHGGTISPTLSTEAAVKANKALMLSKMNNASLPMPPLSDDAKEERAALTTEKRQKLIDFLSQ